nr:hypothetical protein CFP56_36483 [Quercus suber]
MAPTPTTLRTSVHDLRASAGGHCAFPFPHSRFPVELRNQVYRNVTYDKQIVLTPHYTITAAGDTCLGLCLTNHQIYQEYQAENTRHATLHVYVNLSFNAPDLDRAFRGAHLKIHDTFFQRLLGSTENLELRTHDKCTNLSRKLEDLSERWRFKLEYQVPLFAFEEVICANLFAHRLVLEMPFESPGKRVMITNRDLASTGPHPSSTSIFFTPQLILHDFCFSPISVLPARLRRAMHQFSDNRIEYHATILHPPNERCSWYGLNLNPKLSTDFDAFYVQYIQQYLEEIKYAEHSDDNLQAFAQDKLEYGRWIDQLRFDMAQRIKWMFDNMTWGSEVA